MKSWTPIRHSLCASLLLLGAAGTASAQGLPANVHFIVDTSGSMKDLSQVIRSDHAEFFAITNGCTNPRLDMLQSQHAWNPATVYPVQDPGTGLGSDTGFPHLFQDDKFYAYGHWGDLSSPTPQWSTKEQACLSQVLGGSANTAEYNQCLSCLGTKGYFKTSNAVWGTASLDFIFWGRFLNFNPPKYVGMKAALKQVLEEMQGFRVGASRFNAPAPGSPNLSVMLKPLNSTCSESLADPNAFEAHKANYIDTLNSLVFNVSTPLARALLNAGYSFTSDITVYRDVFGFGTGSGAAYFNYPSDFANAALTSDSRSVCWGTQSNAIVIITDGEPTSDSIPSTVLNKLRVLNGGAVYCPDSAPCVGQRPNPPFAPWPDKGTNTANNANGWPDDNLQYLLDDVAKLLHTQDLQIADPPVVGDFDTSGVQRLRIHTIGYGIHSNLLKNTALVGGGLYFTAHDAASLRTALLGILGNVGAGSTSCGSNP